MDFMAGSDFVATKNPGGSSHMASEMCIHHSGRRFIASPDHASIFLRAVEKLVNAGRSDLVPLLHSDGIDMLYVSASTPLIVHDRRDASLDH
jgi:hypothetical protein